MTTCVGSVQKWIDENLLDENLLDEMMLLAVDLLELCELDLRRHDFRSCTLTADDAGDCLLPAG